LSAFNRENQNTMPAFPSSADIDVKPVETTFPTPDTSIRDTIQSAYDGGEASGPPSGTPAASKEDGAPVTPGGAPESAPGGRPRSADGKFAPKPAPAPLDIPKFGEKPPEQAAESAAKPDDPVAKVPASWKPEKAALWEKIADPEARAYIHEREQQLQQGFQRAAQVREVAEGILAEFVPYQDILQAENATPATAIRALLQTAYALRSAQPEYRKALFLQLAQQYGVDLSGNFDPNLAKAQGEADFLKLQQREQQARGTVNEERAVSQQIEQFAATHEFFPAVRETMGRLLKGGVAPDLETAYQQAISLDPNVRAELERRRVAAAQEEQREADRQRAAAATRGGSAPGAGSMGSGGAPKEPGSIRAALEAAWDERVRG
jgi:hypothetical protein